MNPRFQIEFRKSNGDLHVHPKGSLDGSSACELARFLHDRYEGKGRIFIETCDLGVLHPFGCSTFQGRLDRNKVPANRIDFKGEKGFKKQFTKKFWPLCLATLYKLVITK